MTRRVAPGLVVGSLLGAGVVAAAGVATAAAHPGGAGATTGDQIWGLHRQLLWIAVPIALLVEGLIVYTVVRFRHNDEPTPTGDSRRLEIGWTVATALVLVFVGVASFQVLAHPSVTADDRAAGDPPADAVAVEFTASQWQWTVGYPAANVTVERAKVIYLPADRPLVITVTSTDVIHSLHVPALGLKQDAVPGQQHRITTRVTETGDYRLYCAEYCGAGHSQMLATVRVVPPSEFRAWLDEQRASG